MTIINAIGYLYIIFLHISVPLLMASTGLFILGKGISNKAWEHNILITARINLWIGACLGLVAIVIGLVPSGIYYNVYLQDVMKMERNLIYVGQILIAILAIWSYRDFLKSARPKMLFVLLMIIASLVLFFSGWAGHVLT